MTSKIEFYREVLSDDPNSRVFFPLAKMLAGQGDDEGAVSVLKRSIGFHSGHLEARFLLVEMLSRLGREAEASEAFEGLTSLLSNYPSVWSLWASKATGLSRDSSLALRFLALSLQGQDVSWLGLMEQGLAAVSGQAKPAEPVEEASTGPHGESPEGFSLRGADEVLALTQQIEADDRRAPADQLPPECVSESSATVKTRTMADLLTRHGDYASALDIYAELLRLADTDGDKAALSARIDEIKSLMSAGTAPAKPEPAQQPKSKAKLVSMLETLATRLDARATA
ncbi:MAG: hypothetical protein FD177_1908 [Desulfovibrionaceae bacterium]|nr:MAG: hypothetical protein FD177_1908 [Desulfovibrionaceae bacterium]